MFVDMTGSSIGLHAAVVDTETCRLLIRVNACLIIRGDLSLYQSFRESLGYPGRRTDYTLFSDGRRRYFDFVVSACEYILTSVYCLRIYWHKAIFVLSGFGETDAKGGCNVLMDCVI